VTDTDPALLREFLRYEPETGKLYWLPRDRRHFETQRACSTWNAVYPGREALTADNGDGYRIGTICQQKMRAHRVIWVIVHGEWPEYIDHINGDRADTRLRNLRAVSHQENMKNQPRRRTNTSGRMGVSWRDGKWIAYASVDGKQRQLGKFVAFEDACAARSKFESDHGYHMNDGREVVAA
jgi:hypothetical protein